MKAPRWRAKSLRAFSRPTAERLVSGADEVGQSVRRYLVTMHGIDAGRLEAVGRGEVSPLPGHGPMAGENRRVQFRGQ